MKVYETLVGKKPIIFTNNDSAYSTALEFLKNNITPIILDTRDSSEGELVKEVQEQGVQIKFNSGVADTKGHLKIKSATIGKLDEDKENFISYEEVECDCICMSGGWTPTVHLSSQAGNKLKFKEEIDAYVPDQKRQKESAVGAANGSYTLNQSLAEGFQVGFELSNKFTSNNSKVDTPISKEPSQEVHEKLWCMPLPSGKKTKKIYRFSK